MDNKEYSLRSRTRCSWVRSCGNNATDRANNATVNAAQIAVNKFKAIGRTLAGKNRNGKVIVKKSGHCIGNSMSQPATRAVMPMLRRLTQ